MPFISKRLTTFLTVQAASAALCALPAHAQTLLLSNLDSGSMGKGTSLNAPSGGQFGPQNTPYNSKAGGFMLPADTSYLLNSVNLRLDFADTASSPLVQIYADNGLNDPGELLTTLLDPAVNPGTDMFSFTPAKPFTLAAGTESWVVVSNQASSEDSFVWLSSEPTLPTGITTSTGYRLENGVLPPQNPSNVFNEFSVVGSAAVPEASTTVSFGLLLALGIGGAVIAARKRKAAASV